MDSSINTFDLSGIFLAATDFDRTVITDRHWHFVRQVLRAWVAGRYSKYPFFMEYVLCAQITNTFRHF